MKKTKIVCTLGPCSRKPAVIKDMIKAGMDVARINMSHGSHEYHKETINLLRGINDSIPIIADLKGPEIRIKEIERPVFLSAGDRVKLCGKEKVGCLLIDYRNVHEAVSSGSRILLDDGLIELGVDAVENDVVICTTKNSGTLNNNKKVTIPGGNLVIPFPSKHDKEDILFACEHKLEFIAVSFVKQKEDITAVRKIIGDSQCLVIAKIETRESVENIMDIIQESDGIMIARGDLGVELAPEEVPFIQKYIIRLCNKMGKPVITATQMLESMIKNPRPTRAETSDVANAILDGTDAIMLSGESAIGEYPSQAVQVMTKIALRMEKLVRHSISDVGASISQSISHAAYQLSLNEFVTKIITTTTSGFSARMLVRFRPRKQVIAVTHDPLVRNQLMLDWGVIPLCFSHKVRHTHQIIDNALESCLSKGLINQEDVVVLTAGIETLDAGHTNLIEIHRDGEVMKLRGWK